MTSTQFCFWLMGSLELTPPEDGLNEEQTKILKRHLDMCFVHMVKKDGTLKPERKTRMTFDGLEPVDGIPKVNC